MHEDKSCSLIMMYDFVQFEIQVESLSECWAWFFPNDILNDVFIFWTLDNALFLLVPTQRSKGEGGTTSHGNTSTSTEEKDPLLQDDMDWHTHTHINTHTHVNTNTAGVVGQHLSSILNWNTVTKCSAQYILKSAHKWNSAVFDCTVKFMKLWAEDLHSFSAFVSRLSGLRPFCLFRQGEWRRSVT